MDALRKAYQRAVIIPLDNVEQIWQEYNQFENNLNKMTVSFLLPILRLALFCAVEFLQRFSLALHERPVNPSARNADVLTPTLLFWPVVPSSLHPSMSRPRSLSQNYRLRT